MDPEVVEPNENMDIPQGWTLANCSFEHSFKFTINDIPLPNSLGEVLKRLVARLEGRLGDYYTALGEYKSLQLLQLQSCKEIIDIV